jgi:hypothetical protein
MPIIDFSGSDESTKIVFPTDEHFPYHDPYARMLAMTITRDFNPDVRIAGSDGVDFYSLSKFNKNPRRKKTIDDEVDEWAAGQREWQDATPNAIAVFIKGNHEDRLERYLSRHPEIALLRVLQLENFMRLDELGIIYDESEHEQANKEVVFDNLVIKHGSTVRKHSAYSARGEMDKEFYQVNIISGHTHRGGVHYATTRNGIMQGTEGFCLCDLHPPYIDKPNWQQGIVLAETFGNGEVNIEPVLFRRRKGEIYARWRGSEYRVKERSVYGNLHD